MHESREKQACLVIDCISSARIRVVRETAEIACSLRGLSTRAVPYVLSNV